MACTGSLARGSFIALLLVHFTAHATGKEQQDAALHENNAADLLRQQGNKWANLYLPTAVSPTSPCGRAMQAMFTGNSTLWATAMIDAWGKSEDGIFFGNIKFTGVYDECTAAVSPDGKLKGKYCKVYMKSADKEAQQERQLLAHPSTGNQLQPQTPWLDPLLQTTDKESRTISSLMNRVSSIQYGTCMPNVCTEEELTMSVNLQNRLSRGTFAKATCSNEEPEPQFTDADVGFMALFTFLVVLIVCSSAVDMYLNYVGEKTLQKGALRYLLVFSAYTNLTKMMYLNPSPQPGTITCLHGMRVLSMTWVLYSHQQSTLFFNTANLFNVGKWGEGIMAQTVSNGYPSVDTFFFLSGLLVSYSILRELQRRGRFNVALFFFHRLIRLLPPIIITVAAMATVLRFFVSGPYANIWSTLWQANCVKNWWKDVVFVNNFMFDGYCLIQTWYVAVDTQLYIIAPLVILPLFFSEAKGKAWLFVVTVVSAVIPAAIIYAYDYPPTSLMYQPKGTIDYFKNVYMKPWCRVEPWVAGVWLGYIFYKQENKTVKMNAVTVTLGWTIASITGLLVVYGLVNYNSILHPVPYETMTQVVYGGGHRLAWGAALAWLVFACHNGYGGIVDEFLSHPVWQPLSRLTYSIYLVAFPVQFLLGYNLRAAAYFTHINKIIETVGALVLALPCAVLLSLMAESPVMGLERLLLRPSQRPASKARQNSQPKIVTEPNSTEITGGQSNPTFTTEEDPTEEKNQHSLERMNKGEEEGIQADGEPSIVTSF